VPENPETGKKGLDRLLDEGAWEGEREPFYQPFLQPVSESDMEVAQVGPDGVILKDGQGIGIMVDGKPVRGFRTPSRKFEIRSAFIQKIGRNEDCSELIARSGMTKTKNRPRDHRGHDVDISDMPTWFLPREMENLAENDLVMTSFKWNVHNHGRTMNLKWLAEIVHSNPAWLNPATARRLGLADGDWIELTSYYSSELERRSPHLKRDDLVEEDGRKTVATMRVPIVTMEGIHPRAIAMSNSCGHSQYTSVAQARKRPASTGHLVGSDVRKFVDADWERNMWWEDTSGGDPATWKPNTGHGWNQNRLMPIAPDPVSGQQSFHDTIVSIQKL
jgi:anaerobic selenocysteine-containing dehydrogenase